MGKPLGSVTGPVIQVSGRRNLYRRSYTRYGSLGNSKVTTPLQPKCCVMLSNSSRFRNMVKAAHSDIASGPSGGDSRRLSSSPFHHWPDTIVRPRLSGPKNYCSARKKKSEASRTTKARRVAPFLGLQRTRIKVIHRRQNMHDCKHSRTSYIMIVPK